MSLDALLTILIVSSWIGCLSSLNNAHHASAPPEISPTPNWTVHVDRWMSFILGGIMVLS
jgi:hypothetical protein